MKQIKLPISKIKCDSSKYNKKEVAVLKKIFLKKKPIPSPCINKNNEIVANHLTYFVIKGLNHKTIYVVPPQ